MTKTVLPTTQTTPSDVPDVPSFTDGEEVDVERWWIREPYLTPETLEAMRGK